MARRRKYIRLPQRLAAALAMLLPQEQRDFLRAQKARAKVVIGLFDFDHVVLYSHAGSDMWHNLTPMLRAKHIEKTRRDVAIVAKVKRIENGRTTVTRMRSLGGSVILPPRTAGPPAIKRKIPQRINPWPPKGSRRFGKANGPARKEGGA